MKIEAFFDELTFTLTYIVFDEKTRDAVLIDPVLNYEAASSTYSFTSIDLYEEFIKKNQLNLHYILETHAHADHLSGSQELKKRFSKSILAIGENITQVQKTFKEVYHLKELKTDGSQFDRLFKDKEKFKAGSLEFEVFNTPGHTPACLSYYVNQEALFTGDALFIEDYGTGRCDFPAGSASDLYHSVTQKIYTLPEGTKVYPGHDYKPKGRELRFETTIKAQKESNIQLSAHTTEEEFIKFRTSRDATLNAPRLLLQSLQVNIEAGHLPSMEENQTRYLKIPITRRENE